MEKANDSAAAASAAEESAKNAAEALKSKLRKARRQRRAQRDHPTASPPPPPPPPPPTAAQNHASGVTLAVPPWAFNVANDSVLRPRGTAGNSFKLCVEMGCEDQKPYYNRIRVRVIYIRLPSTTSNRDPFLSDARGGPDQSLQA